jgi:hypothetical protein
MSKDIKDERMQILEMGEEGKINPSEAKELLDALEGDPEEKTPKTDSKWLKSVLGPWMTTQKSM